MGKRTEWQGIQAGDQVQPESLSLVHNRTRTSRKRRQDNPATGKGSISPVLSICQNIRGWFTEKHGLISLWPNKAWTFLTHSESLIINLYLNPTEPPWRKHFAMWITFSFKNLKEYYKYFPHHAWEKLGSKIGHMLAWTLVSQLELLTRLSSLFKKTFGDHWRWWEYRKQRIKKNDRTFKLLT